VGDSVNPAWLKQKIRISCKKALRQASMKMQKQGVRLGNFNWPVLLEKQSTKTQFPIAADAASHWIGVPVHQNLTNIKIETIIKEINSLS